MPGNVKTRALARSIGVQTVARRAGVDIQRMIAEKPQQSGPMITPEAPVLASPFEVLPMTSLPGGTRSLAPGTFPAPVPFNSSFDVNRLGPDITNTGCNLISDARLRAACILAGNVIFGGGSRNGSSPVPTMDQLATPPCPTGYTRQADGSCKVGGLGPYLPGDVGPQDFGWQAVNGRYGAGYTPIAVARTTRACPPGSKLGKDGICYDRIARTNRLHDPGAKPFLTGGEVNILRAARRLNRRKSKLLGLFPKTARPAPKKKRR